MSKPKATTFITPKGVARYPRLVTPDTKFDEQGTYSCDVVVSKSEAMDYIKKLRAFWKDATGEESGLNSRPKVYEKEMDEDDNPTGNYILRCRVKNVLAKKGKNAGKVWDRKPPVFDAKRNPLPEGVVLGGGSTVRCAVTAEPYRDGSGVRFFLKSVQVIELVEGGFRDDNDDGSDFDEEEGYEVGSAGGDDFDDDTSEDTSEDIGDDDDF